MEGKKKKSNVAAQEDGGVDKVDKIVRNVAVAPSVTVYNTLEPRRPNWNDEVMAIIEDNFPNGTFTTQEVYVAGQDRTGWRKHFTPTPTLMHVCAGPCIFSYNLEYLKNSPTGCFKWCDETNF